MDTAIELFNASATALYPYFVDGESDTDFITELGNINYTNNYGNSTYFSNETILDRPLVKTPKPPQCPFDLKPLRIGCDVFLLIPITVFGLIGNILAFIVLCNQRQSVSTTLLLQCLAIMDSFLLLFGIPFRTLFVMHSYKYIRIPHMKEFLTVMYIGGFPLVYMVRLICTWLVTLLTINRWIAVCRPLHAQRLVTRRVTLIQIAVTVLSAIVISIPRFVEWLGEPRLSKRPAYVLLYRIIINFLLMYIIPILVLVMLNYKLVKALRYSDRDRAALQQLQSGGGSGGGGSSGGTGTIFHQQSQSVNSPHKSVTLVVVIVTAIFLICNIPALIVQFLFAVKELSPDNAFLVQLKCFGRVNSNISNLLIAVNSAVNFIIYCVCSRNFRMTFMEIFRCKSSSCCCKDRKANKENSYRGLSVTSSRFGLTYLSLTRSRSSTSSYILKPDKSENRYSK